MKNLLRILTIMSLLMMIPIAIFMFLPKLAEWVNQQPWSQNLWMTIIGFGLMAIFIGLDLLNRVQIYQQWFKTAETERETFWAQSFMPLRLGFLRTAVIVLLVLSIILFFTVFYLMILPKVPQGNWYLWTMKVTGLGIALGVISLLNAVVYLNRGKQVILGISETPKTQQEPRKHTLVDKLFQIKPSFMDADVDLKEDFDGISELDNPPPPWFMWLFYSCVIFAGIYLVRYSWLNYAPNQQEEYAQKMQKLNTEKAAYLAKTADNVDENTVTLEKSPEKLAEAKTLFQEKCAACHGQNGEGKNGPNLTDDYWIHGNSVKDVFKTIKHGVLEKGMVAWKEQISPAKMKAVSSYVLSLRGSNPAGAAPPQGEKMEPKETF